MAAHTGVKHHNAKMTVAKVRQARKSYATGKWSIRRLAEKYGVSHQAMWSVVQRKTWQHVA
ncbi:helix-turn-helix domain-containing protein [Streptomyces sp. NPDC058471]|uniref:helix-turn-helix domain-containing protein n=1 Tax=Streptomyces sp. NPDC058471 TaxID=3346516 RepID=UPI00364AAF6E